MLRETYFEEESKRIEKEIKNNDNITDYFIKDYGKLILAVDKLLYKIFTNKSNLNLTKEKDEYKKLIAKFEENRIEYFDNKVKEKIIEYLFLLKSFVEPDYPIDWCIKFSKKNNIEVNDKYTKWTEYISNMYFDESFSNESDYYLPILAIFMNKAKPNNLNFLYASLKKRNTKLLRSIVYSSTEVGYLISQEEFNENIEFIKENSELEIKKLYDRGFFEAINNQYIYEAFKKISNQIDNEKLKREFELFKNYKIKNKIDKINSYKINFSKNEFDYLKEQKLGIILENLYKIDIKHEFFKYFKKAKIKVRFNNNYQKDEYIDCFLGAENYLYLPKLRKDSDVSILNVSIDEVIYPIESFKIKITNLEIDAYTNKKIVIDWNTGRDDDYIFKKFFLYNLIINMGNSSSNYSYINSELFNFLKTNKTIFSEIDYKAAIRVLSQEIERIKDRELVEIISNEDIMLNHSVNSLLRLAWSQNTKEIVKLIYRLKNNGINIMPNEYFELSNLLERKNRNYNLFDMDLAIVYEGFILEHKIANDAIVNYLCKGYQEKNFYSDISQDVLKYILSYDIKAIDKDILLLNYFINSETYDFEFVKTLLNFYKFYEESDKLKLLTKFTLSLCNSNNYYQDIELIEIFNYLYKETKFIKFLEEEFYISIKLKRTIPNHYIEELINFYKENKVLNIKRFYIYEYLLSLDFRGIEENILDFLQYDLNNEVIEKVGYEIYNKNDEIREEIQTNWKNIYGILSKNERKYLIDSLNIEMKKNKNEFNICEFNEYFKSEQAPANEIYRYFLESMANKVSREENIDEIISSLEYIKEISKNSNYKDANIDFLNKISKVQTKNQMVLKIFETIYVEICEHVESSNFTQCIENLLDNQSIEENIFDVIFEKININSFTKKIKAKYLVYLSKIDSLSDKHVSLLEELSNDLGDKKYFMDILNIIKSKNMTDKVLSIVFENLIINKLEHKDLVFRFNKQIIKQPNEFSDFLKKYYIENNYRDERNLLLLLNNVNEFSNLEEVLYEVAELAFEEKKSVAVEILKKIENYPKSKVILEYINNSSNKFLGKYLMSEKSETVEYEIVEKLKCFNIFTEKYSYIYKFKNKYNSIAMELIKSKKISCQNNIYYIQTEIDTIKAEQSSLIKAFIEFQLLLKKFNFALLFDSNSFIMSEEVILPLKSSKIFSLKNDYIEINKVKKKENDIARELGAYLKLELDTISSIKSYSDLLSLMEKIGKINESYSSGKTNLSLVNEPEYILMNTENKIALFNQVIKSSKYKSYYFEELITHSHKLDNPMETLNYIFENFDYDNEDIALKLFEQLENYFFQFEDYNEKIKRKIKKIIETIQVDLSRKIILIEKMNFSSADIESIINRINLVW